MARAQPIEIAGIAFAKKGEALEYLKNMLNTYSPEERVNEEDACFLALALENHPEAKEKIGPGIKGFFVRRADYSTQCFWVERTDGTEVKFSYKSCVTAPK